MSVGAVTARSRGGLAANISGRPSSADIVRPQISSRASRMRKAARKNAYRYKSKRFTSVGRVKTATRLSRIVRTRIPAAIALRTGAATAAQGIALRQIAKLLSGVVLRSTPLTLAASEVAYYLFNKVTEPDGFPGFDNITPGWRSPVYEGEIGSYAPNSFDHGAFNNPPESLLDTDDIVAFTIRYWGDFGTNPYPDPVPGLNWPVVPQVLPMPAISPAAVPETSPFPRRQYKRQRDLSPKTRARPRWRPSRNMEITIPVRPVRGTRPEKPVRVRLDRPRIRADDSKAKPANQFIYNVLKQLANAMGETKEWIDILAEAANYKRGSKLVPRSIRKGHETAAKAYWLFAAGGLNQIDFAHLGVLVVENEIEDRVFGFFGRLGQTGSRNLGLTVGVQTGLVI